MILHFYLTKKLHISYGEPNPITYQLLENYILNISKEKYGQPNDNDTPLPEGSGFLKISF